MPPFGDTMPASAKIGPSHALLTFALLHRAALPGLLCYRQILFIEKALKF